MKITTILQILILTFIMSSTSCRSRPVSSQQTANPNITVQMLFEHEGVKVYRFYDGRNWVFYTDARGKTAWQESSGKATTSKGVETVGD